LRREVRVLEAAAAPGGNCATGADRMRAWLHMMRHCITAWVVSLAACPRDRFMHIDDESPIKLDLLAPELLGEDLRALIPNSDLFAQVREAVARREAEEIALGDLARVGASEMRIRSEVRGAAEKPNEEVERLKDRAWAEREAQLSDGVFPRLSDAELRERRLRDEERGKAQARETKQLTLPRVGLVPTDAAPKKRPSPPSEPPPPAARKETESIEQFAKMISLHQAGKGGVPELIRVYARHIAPRERDGTDWRSTKVVGDKLMNKMSDLLRTGYLPILYAVMSKAEVLCNTSWDWATIARAIELVEKERGAKAMTAFAAELRKAAHAEADRTRWTARLLAPQLASVIADTARPRNTSSSSSARALLALDPALSTGFAVVLIDGQQPLRLDRVGVICVRKSGDDIGVRMNELYRQLEILHREHGFERIAMEGFASQGRAVDDVSICLRGLIRMFAASHSIPCDVAMPQTWKAAVAAGKADKEVIAQAVKARFGPALPSQVWVHEAGDKRRRVDIGHDSTDAVGIAIWGARMMA